MKKEVGTYFNKMFTAVKKVVMRTKVEAEKIIKHEDKKDEVQSDKTGSNKGA